MPFLFYLPYHVVLAVKTLRCSRGGRSSTRRSRCAGPDGCAASWIFDLQQAIPLARRSNHVERNQNLRCRPAETNRRNRPTSPRQGRAMERTSVTNEWVSASRTITVQSSSACTVRRSSVTSCSTRSKVPKPLLNETRGRAARSALS